MPISENELTLIIKNLTNTIWWARLYIRCYLHIIMTSVQSLPSLNKTYHSYNKRASYQTNDPPTTKLHPRPETNKLMNQTASLPFKLLCNIHIPTKKKNLLLILYISRTDTPPVPLISPLHIVICGKRVCRRASELFRVCVSVADQWTFSASQLDARAREIYVLRGLFWKGKGVEFYHFFSA